MTPEPEASPPLPPDMLTRALESALGADAPETAGAHIGPYKLLQEIGEGGFGTVWMAEQQEPIRRRVALKIIKLGMDTREVIARFEAERQALALMDHPNIARVFDAGATEAGRPYFAMELVRGVPITRYCDENRLPPEARLRLHITVCQAVQHAHHKGVVHRDLKPSNILVTMHDGVPVPKVIDFGIAKATSAHLTDKTLFTQFHAFIGTPAYTSPEQMEMSGLDVDTRSDIYSLGVLLYELLTGHPPFDPDALAKSGLEEMRRTIREVDPPRPSAQLGTLSDADRTSVAHQRATESGKLSLLLRGDLDWIVMRCLEKDRTRRYETANGLAMDILRHLASEPVVARPPSSAYRVRKFIRRHKLGFAAALAIVVALVAGLIVSSVLLLRERAAHARAIAAEQAEGKLRQQAEIARQDEAILASRTARDLAGQLLASGRTAEGLAYLVHAARANPRDATIAPRLASLLATRDFLLPVNAPLRFPSRVVHLDYTDAGRKIVVFCEDGTVGFVDTATGGHVRAQLPVALGSKGVIAVGRAMVVHGSDNVVRVLEAGTGRVEREFNFGQPIFRISAGNTDAPILVALLEDETVIVAETLTGRMRIMPFTISIRTRVRFSPDGRWLLRSVGPYLETQLWDLASGELHATVTLPGPFHAAEFSPDNARAVLTFAATAKQFGYQLFSLPGLTPDSAAGLIEYTTTLWFLDPQFSPDGCYLGINSPHGRQMYAASTGEKVGPLVVATNIEHVIPTELVRGIDAVDFTPQRNQQRGVFGGPADRRWLLAAAPPAEGGATTLIAREIASGQPVLPPLVHRAPVANMKLSADGATLLTTSADGFIRLWNLRTGQLAVEPHPSSLGSASALAPDGGELVLGQADGTVQRYHRTAGIAQPLILTRSRGRIMPAPFLTTAPASLLWLESERARVLDAASGHEVAGGFLFPEPIQGITGGRRGIAVRPDLHFMIVRPLAGAWQAWELGPKGVTHVAPLENAPTGGGLICLSAAGTVVAMVPDENTASVRLWDIRSGRSLGAPLMLAASTALDPNLRPGSLSADGRHFAVGTISGIVQVWDTTTGQLQCTLNPMPDRLVFQAEFSPDGTRIATTNVLGEGRMWDASTGRAAGPIFRAGYGGVAFSRDGEFLLNWVGDGIARIRNAATGETIGPPIMHPGFTLRSAAFCADGRRIATVGMGRTALVWDARTGQPVIEPLVHDRRLVAAEFSPDGRFLRMEVAAEPGEAATFHIWSVPPDIRDTPAPEWLLQLATVCAATVVTDVGPYEQVTDTAAQLDDVRRQLATLPADAPFAEWGRWVLSDAKDRPISPGFTITPEEAKALTAKFATAAGTSIGP